MLYISIISEEIDQTVCNFLVKGSCRWFRRPISKETDLSKGEFKIAVAAAAYAIKSREDAEKLNRKQKVGAQGTEAFLTKAKTKKDLRVGQKALGTSDSLLKKAEQADHRRPQKVLAMEKAQIPKVNKVSRKSEKAKGSERETKSSAAKSATLASTNKQTKSSSLPDVKTKVDNWEEAKVAKIKKRYEKMLHAIMSWETEKKAKARCHLAKIESEVDRRRARTSYKYHLEMTRTEKIAGGAKALAEEKKRNEQSMIKDIANKYRSTGKRPVSCFCI